MQSEFLQDGSVAIVEDDSKGKVEGLRRHAEVRSMSANEEPEDETLSWARSVRAVKKRASKSKSPNTRSVLKSRAS